MKGKGSFKYMSSYTHHSPLIGSTKLCHVLPTKYFPHTFFLARTMHPSIAIIKFLSRANEYGYRQNVRLFGCIISLDVRITLGSSQD